MQNWKIVAKRLQYAFIFFYGLVIAFALNDFFHVRNEIKAVEEGGAVYAQILSKYSECQLLEWKAQPECLTRANADGQMKILPSYGNWLSSQRAMSFIDTQYRAQSGQAKAAPITTAEAARKFKLAAFDSSLAMIRSRLIEYTNMTSRRVPAAVSIHLSSLVENVLRRMYGDRFRDAFSNDFKIVEASLRKETDMAFSEEIIDRINELKALRDQFELLASREKAMLEKDVFGGWVLTRVQPYMAPAAPER